MYILSLKGCIISSVDSQCMRYLKCIESLHPPISALFALIIFCLLLYAKSKQGTLNKTFLSIPYFSILNTVYV